MTSCDAATNMVDIFLDWDQNMDCPSSNSQSRLSMFFCNHHQTAYHRIFHTILCAVELRLLADNALCFGFQLHHICESSMTRRRMYENKTYWSICVSPWVLLIFSFHIQGRWVLNVFDILQRILCCMGRRKWFVPVVALNNSLTGDRTWTSASVNVTQVGWEEPYWLSTGIGLESSIALTKGWDETFYQLDFAIGARKKVTGVQQKILAEDIRQISGIGTY